MAGRWRSSGPAEDVRHSLEVRDEVVGMLDVAATGLDVEVVIRLPRDDVRDLAQALDDWLFESRPC